MLQQSSLLVAGVVVVAFVVLGVVALGVVALVVVALVVVSLHLSALPCKYTRVRTESQVKQRKNKHALTQISAEP